jgi:hypothetical protein
MAGKGSETKGGIEIGCFHNGMVKIIPPILTSGGRAGGWHFACLSTSYTKKLG